MKRVMAITTPGLLKLHKEWVNEAAMLLPRADKNGDGSPAAQQVRPSQAKEHAVSKHSLYFGYCIRIVFIMHGNDEALKLTYISVIQLLRPYIGNNIFCYFLSQIARSLDIYRCFLLRVQALNPLPLQQRSGFELDSLSPVTISKEWITNMAANAVSAITMSEAMPVSNTRPCATSSR